jgi:aminopeptidase
MAFSFEQLLDRYADLVVKIGLNLQPGQRLLIQAPIQIAPMVRMINARAYQAGARLVDIMWIDDQVLLDRFRYAPRDSFEEFPAWRADALLGYAQRGDAVLVIYASDPDLLKDQDPNLIATAQKTEARHTQPFSDLLVRSALNWLIVSAPIASWAAKVFPNEAPEARLDRLWDAIFETCRLKEEDPVVAWREHIRRLVARSDYLNARRYSALKYTGPGTDLLIGLPRGHRWKSAQDTSANGITFTPNMPTEEIFTLPDRARTSGTVRSTRPLSYAGTLIEDFSLTFAEGRVVQSSAGNGAAVLRDLLTTDEGASRIGEVALVPHSSPIAQSGLLFYNTLFDENAASHIALGQAYKFTLDGGSAMSDEQFMEAGGNHSLVHVDFMVGSPQLDIDGLAEDGRAEPVMRSGEWAFDV